MLKIGILKEPANESRVSCPPEILPALAKMKVSVIVEKEAGVAASFSDEDYEAQGAQIMERDELLGQADILLGISIPDTETRQKAGDAIWIGAFGAMINHQEMAEWSKSQKTAFSLDLLPRTTRAQSMDILSSQANIAGYKAVLLAANLYPRYFPMFMTAAGSVAPAKCVVIGAGVAGLQAIATARRLGAVVHVSDTRPEVKEQVLSLGAKYIEVEGAADASQAGGYAVEQSEAFKQKQQQILADYIAKSDVVITTAQIQGRKAPIIINKEMILRMRKGSVIIDIASSTGGNTELTKDNETIVVEGVTIVGDSNLASKMPADASKMLGKNFSQFLALLFDEEGHWAPDFEDELVNHACAFKEGQIHNERLNALLNS